MQISFDLGTMNFENIDSKEKSVSKQVSDVINKIKEDNTSESEDDNAKRMQEIQAKIKRGKKLSAKEEMYLKEQNPELYMQYQRIRKMVEAMEHRLKNARSKEEVNDIVYQSINSVSDKDPYKEAVVAAMNETIKDFKKTDAYARLPKTNDEANQSKKSKKNNDHKDEKKISGENENDDEDDFDVMSWTPLQEIFDAMPTFEVGR